MSPTLQLDREKTLSASAAKLRLLKRLRCTLRYEKKAWGGGAQLVAGVDEVGRGAWAGPVSVGVALIPAKATDRDGCGGLELGLARITAKGLELPLDSFRAVSVVRGEGLVDIAGIEQPIKAHDHFGVPSAMPATLRQKGREPLLILDCLIRSTR